MYILQELSNFGIYKSFMDVFSESHIKLALWFALFLLYFMLFSAVRLIADMMLEVSLYFFSKGDKHPTVPRHSGGIFYLIHSIISIFFVHSIWVLLFLYVLANFIAFAFLLQQLRRKLTPFRKIGLIFMNVFFWVTFFSTVFYVGLKLYNGLLKSIGI
ncbi:DUF5366 family protein [Ammoniphilus sp. CFH 90114]|uniref:DUF5366 family protein n=1 Tax=Ammoniphilus sp. CFH 90114 TaxID=2493665 RepID=UPI0034D01BFC